MRWRNARIVGQIHTVHSCAHSHSTGSTPLVLTSARMAFASCQRKIDPDGYTLYVRDVVYACCNESCGRVDDGAYLAETCLPSKKKVPATAVFSASVREWKCHTSLPSSMVAFLISTLWFSDQCFRRFSGKGHCRRLMPRISTRNSFSRVWQSSHSPKMPLISAALCMTDR